MKKLDFWRADGFLGVVVALIVHARMTNILAGARAKVFANGAFLFEPRIGSGPTYFNMLIELYGALPQPAPRSVAAASAVPAPAMGV